MGRFCGSEDNEGWKQSVQTKWELILQSIERNDYIVPFNKKVIVMKFNNSTPYIAGITAGGDGKVTKQLTGSTEGKFISSTETIAVIKNGKIESFTNWISEPSEAFEQMIQSTLVTHGIEFDSITDLEDGIYRLMGYIPEVWELIKVKNDNALSYQGSRKKRLEKAS